MKVRAIIRIVVRVMRPIIPAVLISFCIATNCAAINLGTIPKPPTGSKLRIFHKAISGSRNRGTWQTPNDVFEEGSYRNVHRVLAEEAIYDVVSKEEVESVLGGQSPTAWQWEKDDWTLAIEVGKRLYAEYAMIVVRNFDPSPHFRFILINVATKKRFKTLTYLLSSVPYDGWKEAYKTTLNKLIHDANEDLLSTANRKGRMASMELAETKKEIQELMEAQHGENKKAAPTAGEKLPTPQAVPATIEAGKQEKVAQLEARLANLMETLTQLEEMKKQFEEQRIKTDLLAKELAERDQREKMLLTQLEDSSKDPPVIVLASPRHESKVEVNFIYLSGVAEDEKGVKELQIYLNEKPLINGGERSIRITELKNPKRLEFNERISLEKGINRLKIRAVDADGLFSEKTLIVHYIEKNKNVWAVVVGINTYPNVRQLKYAVNDAKIFYDHLVKHNHIPAENVTLLLNQEATLTKIKSTLGTYLKSMAGKDDMVVIFFAGHGATERDAFSPDGDGLEKYLLPFDVDLKDLYATALPMGELSRIFDRIRSERLIFIADACYSGASGGRTISMAGMRASISEAFMDRIAGGKGRVVITASGANEVSAEKDELQHGVFTYFLIEGLKGAADIDKDGLVTVDEAYNYVSEHVPQATAQEQHPVKKGIVEGRLILSVSR